MVELRGLRVRDSGRLRKALRRHVSILEEGDRRTGTEFEEVMPEGVGADRRDQPRAEHSDVEAHRLVHVTSDEREMIHASPPRRCAILVHRLPTAFSLQKGCPRGAGLTILPSWHVAAPAAWTTGAFVLAASETGAERESNGARARRRSRGCAARL